MRILLVEDEVTLCSLIAQNLRLEGFIVEQTGTGQGALALLQTSTPDLMILDLMLPDQDGFQVLEALRAQGNPLPVIMLTARGEEESRLKGLNQGADDYIVKPFSILELIARIHAVARRTGHTQLQNILTGPFEMDRMRKQVFFKARPDEEPRSLQVTDLEYRLMEILVLHAGSPCSQEELMNLLWSQDPSASKRALTVHISNLRKKISELGIEAPLKTVGRVGRSCYCWTLAPEDTEA